MCLPLDPLEPPTQKGRIAVSNLQMLAFVQLALIFAKIILALNLGALLELFIVIILWSAWAQLSYCTCIFYIVFCLYQVLMIFVLFATRFQNGQPLFGDTPRQQAVMLIFLIGFFFYMIASYVAFLAYREFKAIQYEANGNGPLGSNQHYDQERAPMGQQGQQQQQQNQRGGFQPFVGRGVALA